MRNRHVGFRLAVARVAVLIILAGAPEALTAFPFQDEVCIVRS